MAETAPRIRSRNPFAAWAIPAALVLSIPAFAAPPRALDRQRIHGLYRDGEFERVIRELDAYDKGRCACARSDSVFAEKHLAVVLAANPATRELGRYHMHRLLDLAPRADLLDMYVGEEVDAVFEKVRKEHSFLAAAAAPARPAPKPSAARALPADAPAEVSGAASPRMPAGKSYSDAWTRLPAASASRAAAALPRAQALSGPATGGPAPSQRALKKGEWTPSIWDEPETGPGNAAPAATAVPVPRMRAAPPGAAPPKKPAATVEGTHPLPGSRAAATRPAQAVAEAAADSARSAWKRPGLWIGGGAALAVVAFALLRSGSEDAGPGKTYAVPANVSR